MDGEEKEVYFSLYCHQCKNKDTPETEDPCNECLAHPSMPYSHKPMHFKEKDVLKKEVNND